MRGWLEKQLTCVNYFTLLIEVKRKIFQSDKEIVYDKQFFLIFTYKSC
jgi:hypothetical protein